MDNIFSTPKPEKKPIDLGGIVAPTVASKKSGRNEDINILDLIDITQKYEDGKITVFEHLNFSVPDITGKGQFIVIMGESGCGKSTILRYIANLNKPTSGTFLMRGQPHDEKIHVPMVFQQYSSFPWKTVLQNVALPLILGGMDEEKANKKAMEMIEIVGLKGHENKWAKYPTLSGGQLQRVAIARNLVANPNILLMDEPFGALDGMTRNQMQLLIRHIFEEDNGLDPTVILVTHDVREAVFLASDIFIMSGKPAVFTHHIEINLPDIRDKNTKKNPLFFEYVEQIEEITTTFKNKKE
jgi:NitT/TauT family transport system ATP-binding protein